MPIPLKDTETIQLARTALRSNRGAGLPELLKLIETLTADIGETTISDIAELIEKDPAVLGRLLSVANTIVHNPHVSAMTSIPHAIHRLGFQRVRSLAVSLMLVENTGGTNNPIEQREATAKALCAGLLAHGCAQRLGVVEPELAFACAALRQIGYIILPIVSLEHFREVPVLMKTLSEDAAYRELFGLTPLELSRELLSESRLPGEVTEALQECQPALMSATTASTYSAKALGIADFSGRLAGLALDGGANAAKFDTLAKELAEEFEVLLPGVGVTLDGIMQHADERIGSYTRSEGVAALSAPSLNRIHARALHKNPAAVRSPAVKKPSPVAAPKPAPAASQPIPLPAKNATPPAGEKSGPPTTASNAPLPEPLTHTKAFEVQPAAPAASDDKWNATLTFVRDSFGAQECWLFEPHGPPGRFQSSLGLGPSWEVFRGVACAQTDERTVFGICLTRRENVVIHDTTEPTLAPYLPEWFRRARGAPGAFILMPLILSEKATGLVLIGWSLPQRIKVTASQTELAGQLFLTANRERRSAAPFRAA